MSGMPSVYKGLRMTIVIALAIVVAIGLGTGTGCRKHCGDAPDLAALPIVHCDPLPAGATEGCIGPPGTDAGPGSKLYPTGCTAEGLHPSSECGYESYRCDPFSTEPHFKWVLMGI
jgi:hypothetical protein